LVYGTTDLDFGGKTETAFFFLNFFFKSFLLHGVHILQPSFSGFELADQEYIAVDMFA
jgi:hypothetical protein